MLLRIEHEITYIYSQPVVLEPHSIRLKPRSDPFHAVVESSVKISPEPSGISEMLDLEGTSTYMAWFLGKTSSLTITMDSLVKMSDREPFDFIVYPFSSLQLPVVYSEEIHWRLHYELAALTNDPAIELLADETAREVQGDTLKFLTLLAKRIADEFTYTYRESGDPYTPEKTFALHEGSCRDLSLVYMAACRHMGLASRFVSGYYYDPDLSEHHLHAWVEVYIPGGGWRGFDPTNGVAVHGKHVAIATSAQPSLTTPVSGTYRGDASQTLSATVRLAVIDPH